MPYIVATAAGVLASLADPVMLIAGTFAIILGCPRKPAWFLVTLAVGVTTLKLAVLWQWWVQIGLANEWPRHLAWMTWINLVFLAIPYTVAVFLAKPVVAPGAREG